MAYIGKSPTGTGVRQRYYFTASGSETSLSGTDDNGLTLVFSDGNFVDVSLNGVALVAGTDYNTSTANTIAGLAALSAGDIVEIVVYDIFSVADTVSAKDGGTFSGNIAMGGTLSVTGASTATGGLNVGIIKEVTGTTTAMTIDSTGRILTPARPAFSGSHIHASSTTAITGTIIMNTEDFDIGGSYDNSTGIYTIPITGIYSYSFSGFAAASGDGGNVTGQKTVTLQTNASGSFVDYQGMTMKTTNNAYPNLSFSGLISATAGNQLKIQTVDSNTEIFVSTSSFPKFAPRFSIHLVG